MCKLQEISKALEPVKDGATVMIGGFMGVGAPHSIIETLVERGVSSLTVIANDAGVPMNGIGKLVEGRQIDKLVASHIGLNPKAGKQMNAEEMTVELVPQGTLAERIRAGGVGLGGVLTPTGLGTMVEEGKEKRTFGGREYLLEFALGGDFALIKGDKADRRGNLTYRMSQRNFNPVMATAARTTIVEVDEIVDEIDPEAVDTPGIFVDRVVKAPKQILEFRSVMRR